MDPFLFITTLVTFITNLLGVRDMAAEALIAAGEHSETAVRTFRIWLAKKIAGPIAFFMRLCAAGLSIVWGMATYIHFWVWQRGFWDGRYALFFFATAATIGIILGWAYYQKRSGTQVPTLIAVPLPLPPGHHGPRREVMEVDETAIDKKFQPKRVSFFFSGLILIVSVALMSLSLEWHAVAINGEKVGSRGLLVLSMMTSNIGILTVAGVLVVLGWIVLRGGGFMERALQVAIETAAPILGGVTYKNVREKLFPKGLNLIEEEKWAANIALIAGMIFVIKTPYDLILLVWPTESWAKTIFFPYFATVTAGYVAYRRPKLREKIDGLRDKFYYLVFRLVPAALLLLSLFFFLRSTRIGKGVEDWTTQRYNDVAEFVEGSDAPPSLEKAKAVSDMRVTPVTIPTAKVPAAPKSEDTTHKQTPKPPSRVVKQQTEAERKQEFNDWARNLGLDP